MGATRPKQYLPLLGRAVIVHTLERLCTYPRLDGVLVGLAPDDPYWPDLRLAHPRLLGTFGGGAERAATVLNGLRALSARASSDDWVLVHDAVRPCITHPDLDRLIDAVGEYRDGGLLGVPVADTLKRVDERGSVLETVPRAGLWRALTPQMFRVGALTQALEAAQRTQREITDEAAAIEATGGRPRMVAGSGDNMKITVPEDLALAEMILRKQGEHDHG